MAPLQGRGGRLLKLLKVVFFFFQAEDGIRDKLVTGVQTCALPICRRRNPGLPGGSRISLWRIEQAAGMMARVSLLPKHRRLVRDILAEHLPSEAREIGRASCRERV